VAEYPELWSDRSPVPGPLFNREHRFGVARDLERMREGTLPVPARALPYPEVDRIVRDHPLDHRVWQCRSEARTRPLHGRSLMHMRIRWANRNRHLDDVWHRLMCRAGRHEIHGGEQIQVGSRLVNVERRCRWCDAGPSLHQF